jgi:hypothetical protein
VGLKKKHAVIAQRYRDKLNNRGLCWKCRDPLDNIFRTECARCRRERVERNRAKKLARWREGKCFCGRELDGGFRWCAYCRAIKQKKREAVKRVREYQKQVAAGRKAAGLCVSCGLTAPQSDRVKCARCLKEHATISRQSYAKHSGILLERNADDE